MKKMVERIICDFCDNDGVVVCIRCQADCCANHYTMLGGSRGLAKIIFATNDDWKAPLCLTCFSRVKAFAGTRVERKP